MSPQIEIKIFPDEPERKMLELPEGSTYEDLLDVLDINQELVVLLNDGKAVPIDDIIEKGTISILKAISGG